MSGPKHVLTEGLRLAYTPGLLGLHFRIAGVPDSYPNDDVLGGRDMAYINGLIAADEKRRAVATPPAEVTTCEREVMTGGARDGEV